MTDCTIVIPTHNRADLLARAVVSALRACPPDGEVLVVDDHSRTPASEVLLGLQDVRLRVVRNSGTGGAACARNLGVEQARGELIFFLDDDDEITADYCSRILAFNGPSRSAEWGFSSTMVREGQVISSDSLRTRKRLRRGLIPRSAWLRERIAAMSDGLWIQKELFLRVGGLDPRQTIDEDTDLCVRLQIAGSVPWYETEPGVVVYRGYTPTSAAAAQLTVATPAARGLDCYRRTHDKNADFFNAFSSDRWFLSTRFLRRAVKTGKANEALKFVREQRPWPFALALWVFVSVKRLAHR